MPERAGRASSPWVDSSLGLLARLRGVLAAVDAELRVWRARAEAIPDGELRRQALASLTHKRFHCEGGSVFAAASAPAARPAVVRAIVALQTVSDYLDNLSDRSPQGGEADLRRLHAAFTDALAPRRCPTPGSYYDLHPHGRDGGYLAALVAACRAALASLPAWDAAEAAAGALAARYVVLQSLKHLDAAERGARLRDWAAGLAAPGLRWYEAAAACGSTLGIFALMAAASRPGCDPAAAAAVAAAYFPWPSALHILLDYLIDLDEDRHGGDFNFVACYPSPAEARSRLRAIQVQARRAVAALPDARFHRLVVAGLPALYLADPKVAAQGLQAVARPLLWDAGPAAWLLHAAVRCPLWRGRPTGSTAGA
jgi:tetraprenyl-beta-curcumene synthase